MAHGLHHQPQLTSPASSPSHSELYALTIRRWFEFPENSKPLLPWNALHPLLSSAKPYWAFKSQFRSHLIQEDFPDAYGWIRISLCSPSCLCLFNLWFEMICLSSCLPSWEAPSPAHTHFCIPAPSAGPSTFTGGCHKKSINGSEPKCLQGGGLGGPRLRNFLWVQIPFCSLSFHFSLCPFQEPLAAGGGKNHAFGCIEYFGL